MKKLLLTFIAFPLVVILGKLFPKKSEAFELQFVNLNNRLIKFNNSKYKDQSKSALLLLPHCLQFHACEHKIIESVQNCEGCGRCDISKLAKLEGKYDIAIRVATGGRIANRYVNEIRPDFIVAVACERELTCGISSVNPLPIMGIPNSRPNGPCRDTFVDVDKVEDALKYWVRNGHKDRS
ncbi:MAG: hypothetical protein A2W07_07425 [candidate division Zixibacteria bacterium RBG_16_43_9]|nr:MAG: hypothetical protein A2W07_07425 [candidate division Zixibacteria bacterium RBG_16_43_9]